MGTSINMIEAHYSHIISRDKASKLILTTPIPENDILDAKGRVEKVEKLKKIPRKKHVESSTWRWWK